MKFKTCLLDCSFIIGRLFPLDEQSVGRTVRGTNSPCERLSGKNSSGDESSFDNTSAYLILKSFMLSSFLRR